MNSKLFARAFADIKKQSQTEKAKKNLNSKPQQAAQNPQLKKTQDMISKDKINDFQKNDQKQLNVKPQPLIKRISKQTKNITQQNIKRWRNDLHHKIQNKKDQQKANRTIFVQDSNYQELIKVLKNYKIFIEQIKEYKVVLNDPSKKKQCYDILIKSNIKARLASDKSTKQIPQISEEQKEVKSRIFDRIR